jgi:dipeptidyl-peptidase-4
MTQKRYRTGLLCVLLGLTAILWLVLPPEISGQSLLKTMPGYARYEQMRQAATNAVELGSVSVTWKDEGKAFEYRKGGKRYRFDIEAGKATEISDAARTNAPAKSSTNTSAQASEPRFQNAPRPARGRQYAWAISPDGSRKAYYKDRNLWLTPAEGTNDFPVTTDGSEAARVKYGTATWTYGEELDQNTAIWWSSNSQKIAFYRFDESLVPDFFVLLNQTGVQGKLDVEPYPKAGSTNPVVDLLIYDLATSNTVALDVRDGKLFSDSALGHYVYGIRWLSDSSELLFHRTERLQKVMELCAADPQTGRCRVVVREEWLPSWVENSPPVRFLKDGRRFLWTSERTGWRNLYLYDISGVLLATLTDHLFDVGNVPHVDEDARLVYYTARSGDNPLKMQLHCVGLDSTGERRLTDPAFHHTINFAPDGRHYIDVFQTHDVPPVTRLMRSDGQVVGELATSDMTRFRALGLKTVELFEFQAADGETPLYGMLHFPSNFSPRRKYPLLVSVYAGPATSAARETFTLPNMLTEFGFLYASLDSRSAEGRGKRSLDSIYLNLGDVEIADQAAGVEFLAKRGYVDGQRVGIYGTSYGGTASALCLLKYPGVFAAACSSSAVADFRNYDTIYTERYLGLPQQNKAAYDRVCLMTYATNLAGALLLFYGSADDNVHPSNALQFIQALQKAEKSFEVQVGPDQGHASVNRDRMMEFFIQHLVLPPHAERKLPQPPMASPKTR